MVDTYIVADVGGTQIRAALFSTDQDKPRKVVRTSTQGRGSTAVERLLNLMESIWPAEERVKAIAVAAPGPIEPYQGIVYEAPNIPGWTDLPLKALIHQRFNTQVAVGNDANLAAMGEWKFGAGRGFHHLVYITVSTGIGGGVITNDQLLLGVHGLAAELGHITVIHDGPLCGCGQRGHLEAISSGPAIARWVEQELVAGVPSILAEQHPLTSKDVYLAAEEKDTLAIAALARAGKYLGVAIADYLHIFNPSAIIIGGGVSHSGDHLMNPLREALQTHVLSSHYLDGLVLTRAALGDEVGLMGALALAQSLPED